MMENYDIKELLNRLNDSIKYNNNLFVFPLGFAREYPILCIRPRPTLLGPKVLVSGGFHGDEVSGPWGIVEYLENNDYPTDINLSILPLVNPTGFALSRRANYWGVGPNRGYVKGANPGEKASYEDDILKSNINILSVLSKDCYIALHEDDEEQFYFFSYGKDGDLEKKLREMGSDRFGLVPKERMKLVAGSNAKSSEGSVKEDYDSSFEHGLKDKGVKRCITVEVPGRRDFNERVDFVREVLEEMLKPNYYQEGYE